MEKYDEDLSQNTFLQALTKDYSEILDKAVEAGWVICVPRVGAIPKYAVEQDDILGHILIPSEELPETHYRTLKDQTVVLKGDELVLEKSLSKPHSVHILFDETFYRDDMKKYKVLCLEDLLYVSQSFKHVGGRGLIALSSLRDCADLLWAEMGGQIIHEKLDLLVNEFLTQNSHLEENSLQTLQDLGNEFYTAALQVVLADSSLAEKVEKDHHLAEAIKLAIETYIIHGIYKKLMKGVIVCCAEKDAKLNRIIKNLSDLQVRDLDIAPQLASSLTKAKIELINIEYYTTPLGKLGCLRKAIAQVTGQEKPLSSDELLPVLLFLVIKANLPNWFAHISFLKFFRFSSSGCGSDSGEHSYFISSLEAAAEHIFSGSLFGSVSPEADSLLLLVSATPAATPVLRSMEEALSFKGIDPMARYFECIRLGKAEDVQEILDGKYKPFSKEPDEEEALREGEAELCHPLCSCDHCERLVAKPKMDMQPTIHTRDDRGYTGLHIACIFGRPAVVDLLITCRSDLHATDFRGATPLHYASQRGHQNAVLLLLHAGSDINKSDGDLNTALHLCCLNGHVACVKALLFYAESVGCHIDINSQNNLLDTPLHLASRWGYSAIVELLLERLLNLGLELKVYNNRKQTAFDCAHNHHIARMILNAKLRKDERQELVRVDLSTRGTKECMEEMGSSMGAGCGNIEAKDELRYMKHIEKMLKSVRVGDIKLACYYLGIEESVEADDRVSVSAPSALLCHPLCQCPSCAAQTSVREHGEPIYRTPINATNSEGESALHVATTQGHTHLVQVLLCQGANPNLQTRGQRLTPLHLAVQNSNLELIELLLKYRARTDLQDVCGNTALHHCCFRGFDQGVHLLLQWKAPRDISNLSDHTPAQEAEQRGHWHIVEMLFGKMPN